MTEAMVVELPADKVYRLLLDYFTTQPKVKVKKYKEPSLINVWGGWRSYFGKYKPWSINIRISPENGKTRTEFDFFFFISYILSFVLYITGLMVLNFLLGPRAVLVTLPIMIIFFALEPYRTHKAKENVMREIRDFLKEKNVVCLYAG